MTRSSRRWHEPSLPSLLPVLAVLLLLIVTQASAASAVLGVDIGTEYIKAALVKPGIPLEIVLTKDSRRKEASTLAFKPAQDGSAYPERLYGSDAGALAARFPGDVFPNLKPLLGSVADTVVAAASYRSRFPALQLVDYSGGLALHSKTLEKEKEPFSVEELLSMEIQSMKANAESMAGKGTLIRDAVITVPAYYTVDERRAVQAAAELAGLKVMSLASDGLAVGLNYATSRTFPNVDTGEQPEYHLVYDMGAGSTTATILRFQARNAKGFGKVNKTIQEVSVLGTGWDKTLGGDALNQLIVEDMIEKFVASSSAKSAGVTSEGVKKHGRAMAKIWKESERMRMVLSANQETSASFEGLYDDVDFRYKLARADFESMAASYGLRLVAPIETALAGAKLEVSQLDSVVLHGGTVRTPFVQRALETLIGDSAKLRSNVNADESAVFGAAFRAAGLSPSFRVKEIVTDDIANYGVTLKWTSADGKNRRQNMFVPTSAVGTAKQMPMALQEDFTMSFVQHVGEEERLVCDIKVANLTASIGELTKTYNCPKDVIKTQFTLRLDPATGLPEVSGGTVTCEYDPSQKKEGMVDGVKNLFGWGSKKDDNETEGATEEKSEASSSSASGSKSKETPKPKKPSRKIATINLKLDVSRTDSKVISQQELQRIKARLVAFDRSDEARRLREETFNILEGLTYRVRDMLTDDSVLSVSSKGQRDAIDTLLSSTSDWLYGDGASATLEALKAKVRSLQDLVDPITFRKQETSKRPAAIEALESALNSSSSIAELVENSISRAAEASESAMSAAEVAASTASSVVSEAASAVTDSATVSEDDLEDEEAPPSTSSTESAPVPTWSASPFSKWDLSEIQDLYERTKQWLAEQRAAQDKLSASDVPVLVSGELERRAEQLNDAVVRLLMKQQRAFSSSSSSSRTPRATKSKGKSTKTKGKKSASTTAAASSPSAAQAETSEVPAASPAVDAQEPAPEPEPHDEL